MKYTVKVLIMLSLCYQPVLLLAELPRRTPGLSLMVGGSKSQKQLERSQAGLSNAAGRHAGAARVGLAMQPTGIAGNGSGGLQGSESESSMVGFAHLMNLFHTNGFTPLFVAAVSPMPIHAKAAQPAVTTVQSHTRTDAVRENRDNDIPDSEEAAEEILANGIYFIAGTARLVDKSKPGLARICSYLRNHPAKRLSLVTMQETDNHENTLMYLRSRAVKNYIVKLGMDPDRIIIKREPF
jgi:hypothetical protein